MEVAIAISAPQKLHHNHHHSEKLNSKTKGKKLLSLENYLAFLRSRDHHNLTAQNLKQIISIHGFKQIDHRKKLEEAIEVIELIDPTRSTLNDKISSKTSTTLKETIKDLESLNWQECSVTAIRSINSSQNYAPVPSEIATKSPTPRAKKRSKSTPPSTSLSPENDPKESNSRSSSSSLTQKAKKKTKLATPATSSSTSNHGSGLSKSCSGSGLPNQEFEVVPGGEVGDAGASASGGVGAAKREMSRKRKSIKRILSIEVVAAADTSN